MDRIPVTSWQQRLLHTYVTTCDSLPVNRIGQTMKNVGVLQCSLPKSPAELVDAIIAHGNIAFVMLRRFLAMMDCYELSLNLRQERELFKWVWLSPGGKILQKSTDEYKNEDTCLEMGYKRKPAYVHVCLESVPSKSIYPCIILV